MDYTIEIYDRRGLRVGRFTHVALLEARRTAPDEPDVIEGLVPAETPELGPGYRVAVYTGDKLFCEAEVVWVGPQWSDTKKLILDRYVRFHEILAFRAERRDSDLDTRVVRGYAHWSIGEIVKDAISAAVRPIHYRVAHGAYPEGAMREYEKYLGRRVPETELEAGGISSGQWVETPRLDASAAYAKDGDTIAGLAVDGEPWPDLRLMMIDSEELTKNSHAVKRHPEIADWTAERYASSGYALAAEAARQALQDLLDNKGLTAIELNPHRDHTGAFDDRVDHYGRYIGLAYGGGECFNAAIAELGHADVYLYQDGKYHVPEMRLKEYFSYTQVCEDSVAAPDVTLEGFEAAHSVFGVLTALAYASGSVWRLDTDGAVRFRNAADCDHALTYDHAAMGMLLAARGGVVNALYFEGNPLLGPFSKTYVRGASVNTFGFTGRRLRHYGIWHEADADRLAAGVLDDLAYPEACGSITMLDGSAAFRVGELLEVRGHPVRRLDPAVDGEWGGRFAGQLVRRVNRITHRFSGRVVRTTLGCTSPLRSVGNPLRCMTHRQETEMALYQFRLDDPAVGLDSGYHLG